ncbi:MULTISPECIES: polynucleotide kinase-phosphatase [Priestia]|nr:MULTISPECIES: polynucleotide kinase-phosphatase [Priestia]SCB86986.1 polynucleotide kinase-phosphatase [Priestia flexa]
MKKLFLPPAGIVLLMGPSNSGKTTLLESWIKKGYVKPSETVSSDQFRLLVGYTDFIEWTSRPKDEADVLLQEYQTISQKAFETMEYIIETRSKMGKLTIVDATHLYEDDRKRYIDLAKKNHIPCIALLLDVPTETLLERDENREFPRGKKRVKQQAQVFAKSKRSIKREGFRQQYVLTKEDISELEVVRTKNKLELDVGTGIDVIGDIHACYEELIQLLERLGYEPNEEGFYTHPNGRKFLSVGDVMSRGPRSLDSMLFFKRHVEANLAYMIDSNHGWKIARWLGGRNVTLTHGDEKVADEFTRYEEEHGTEKAEALKRELKDFLLEAPSHYILTKNDVRVAVVTHAGIKDEYIGKQSYHISDFCRYGDSEGFYENGKPIRKDWYTNHHTKELIIWGHDCKVQPLVVNNTVNIDQGAVFGGSLTAFQYPEKQFVSVKAKENYSGTEDNPLTQWQKKRLDPPNIARFLNGYSVLTDTYGDIKVLEGTAKSAIDSVSHFTIPIEELIYIPPTMSPTPKPPVLEGYLEHPKEAFDYYQSNDVQTMVVEKKHMGSRGVLLLFKDKETAVHYVGRETLGTIYTRTGRSFFAKDVEEQILSTLNEDLMRSNYFSKYNTDFVLLDAEILPWNLKAKELISSQYAHVAEVALLDRRKLSEKLKKALKHNQSIETWLSEVNLKLKNAEVFNEVFQKYCWNIDGVEGIQIAPFHVLAHSGETFFDKTHLWHMERNAEFSSLSDLFISTDFMVVHDEKSMNKAIEWWESITEEGHEGFVVKPETFIARNEKGKLLQPAIKVRGRKYLHIIYGMDYLMPENLNRLKQRNTSKKQKHALLEFALGIEGITRFVNKDSIERIHECALGTLALEMEPVDPRL